MVGTSRGRAHRSEALRNPVTPKAISCPGMSLITRLGSSSSLPSAGDEPRHSDLLLCLHHRGTSSTSGDIRIHIFYFGRIKIIFWSGSFHPQHHLFLHQGKPAAWLSRERYKYHFQWQFLMQLPHAYGSKPTERISIVAAGGLFH